MRPPCVVYGTLPVVTLVDAALEPILQRFFVVVYIVLVVVRYLPVVAQGNRSFGAGAEQY